MKELTRTKQCKTCPWKVSSNPFEIPNDYCEVKHKNLKNTIAEPGQMPGQTLRVMSCHYSNGEDEMMCVGWIYNQVNQGNNIALRLKMLQYSNRSKIQIDGPQHETFEQTFPENKMMFHQQNEKLKTDLLSELSQMIDTKFSRKDRSVKIERYLLESQITLVAIARHFHKENPQLISNLLKSLVREGKVESNIDGTPLLGADYYFIPKSEL